MRFLLRSVAAGAVVASTLSLAHCSRTDAASDTSPDASTDDKPTVYRGLLTGARETGVLDVTVGGTTAAKAGLRTLANTTTPVSGTLSLVSNGGRITLSGSYDPVTSALTLTGSTGSGTYTLTGTASDAGFSGTYTSPSGSGSFSLARSGAPGAVTLYCGTFTGQASGVWNLVVAGARAMGSFCDEKKCALLEGSVAGSDITLSVPSSPTARVRGTLAGATVSGTYEDGSSQGTWSGSTDACQAPEPLDASTPDGSADASDGGADTSAPELRETLVGQLDDPVDLDADGTHVYVLVGGTGVIGRCAQASCTSLETVVDKLSVPSSIAIRDGKLFFATGFRYISACDAGSGTCTPAEFIDVGASTYPTHLVPFGTRLYWISESGATRRVQTCPLSGCSAGYPKTVFQSAMGNPLHGIPMAGLAVSDEYLYVSSFTGGIFRVALTSAEAADAATVMQLQPSGYGTSGLELDGPALRWAVLGDNKLSTCAAPDCTSVSDRLAGLSSPAATRATETHVYGIDRGTPKAGGGYVASTGALWRLAR